MLGLIRKNPEQLAALNQLEVWTRERFSLPEDAVVMAAEVACEVPGCPPLETVVLFWLEDQVRYRFKLFKRATEVVQDDLPISWLMSSLIDYDDLGFDCC